MDMIYQRMRHHANIMAVDIIETKLRDTCCVLQLQDDTQREECLRTLRKMKRIFTEHNKVMQRILCESSLAIQQSRKCQGLWLHSNDHVLKWRTHWLTAMSA